MSSSKISDIPEAPGRLVSHFQNRDGSEAQSQGWSELWESNESDLWDRGKPSPALVDFVERYTYEQSLLLEPSDGRRLKALVPGCGRGYDVVMLALHGMDAYGLEVSQTAVDAANEYANIEQTKPRDHNFSSPDPTVPSFLGSVKGTFNFVVGDFFKSHWEDQCKRGGEGTETGFDLIYDYTFLCALPPDMRRRWAERMIKLLNPTGILVCLEFPLYKDLDARGPPWGLKGVHCNLLGEGGDGLLRETDVVDDSPDVCAEMGPCRRLLYYKPDRTYDVGKSTETDMISVWRLM